VNFPELSPFIFIRPGGTFLHLLHYGWPLRTFMDSFIFLFDGDNDGHDFNGFQKGNGFQGTSLLLEYRRLSCLITSQVTWEGMGKVGCGAGR
jgi:hypothetical protein